MNMKLNVSGFQIWVVVTPSTSSCSSPSAANTNCFHFVTSFAWNGLSDLRWLFVTDRINPRVDCNGQPNLKHSKIASFWSLIFFSTQDFCGQPNPKKDIADPIVMQLDLLGVSIYLFQCWHLCQRDLIASTFIVYFVAVETRHFPQGSYQLSIHRLLFCENWGEILNHN